MGIKIGGEIEKVNGKEVSYSEFVEKFMAKNLPVVLTGLMDDWRACKDWVTQNGQPNLQFFSTHFGKSKVQVADCGTREFTDQKRLEMSVSEFVKYWLDYSSQENVDVSVHGANGISVLYLKDWHFVKEYPEYIAYRTPLFFCDDWLNMYLDNYRLHKDPDSCQKDSDICCSDYRFVYMGAKGSWTPLHADVFRSYSWSANVCGKKKWFFLSPSQCHLVFDRNLKNSVYNIFDDVSETNFPGFKKTIWLECTQEQNEIIFVPSGWYHQVHNVEDTISINHNWFNGYNLPWVWDLLLKDYNEAKEYIEDIRDICDDFEGLCQRNLAANTGMSFKLKGPRMQWHLSFFQKMCVLKVSFLEGMNFNDFFTFISHFSLLNVVILFHLLRDYENLIWSSSPVDQHLASNLVSIRKIALKMISVAHVAGSFGFFVDLKETLDYPEFLKLCGGWCRTYGMIHEAEKWSCEMKKNFIFDFADCGYLISSPEDLVKFIDHAAGKLDCYCHKENILLSTPEDG